MSRNSFFRSKFLLNQEVPKRTIWLFKQERGLKFLLTLQKLMEFSFPESTRSSLLILMCPLRITIQFSRIREITWRMMFCFQSLVLQLLTEESALTTLKLSFCINQKNKTWRAKFWNFILQSKNWRKKQTLRTSSHFFSTQPTKRKPKKKNLKQRTAQL